MALGVGKPFWGIFGGLCNTGQALPEKKKLALDHTRRFFPQLTTQRCQVYELGLARWGGKRSKKRRSWTEKLSTKNLRKKNAQLELDPSKTLPY